MKHYLKALILILLFSCENDTQIIKTTENIQTETEAPEKKSNNNIKSKNNLKFKDIKGSYVGDFIAKEYNTEKSPSYSNRINISLDSVNSKNDILFGHSVVAGNIRPFQGKIRFVKGDFHATVKEPGDDKYDGFFRIHYIANNPKFIYGTWIANDTNLAVISRRFVLENKKFIYDKNLDLGKDFDWASLYNGEKEFQFEAGEYEMISSESNLNASMIKLTNSDVENLNKGELEIIRNTIYARHGYSFKNRRMRYFFDSHVDWYIPVSTDVREKLTPLEKENIDLLKRYEEHAEKYYDTFGR